MLLGKSRPFSMRPLNEMGFLNMPIDLILVRHGIAEGNRAFREALHGNTGLLTPRFLERHESQWRLTPEGRNQALITGAWIRENISDHFGRYMTSEYVRALETAALLCFPQSNWEREVFLRERNFGRLASLSYDERERRFQMEMQLRKRDHFYWVPPSGESLANLALRIDYILDSLSEFPLRPSSAIIVSHFNVLQIFRTRLEHIRQKDFEKELIQADEHHKIRNCCVIHYTRRDPATKQIWPGYRWKKFATPWLGKEFATPKWEEITYTALTNEQIRKEIEEQFAPNQ
jgi:broad specificity phosphatase PhoE